MAKTKKHSSAFFQGVVLGGVYFSILLGWFWGLSPLAWMGLSDGGSLLVTVGGLALAVGCQSIVMGLVWMTGSWLLRQKTRFFLILFPAVWVAGLWYLNLQPLGLPWGFLAYSQASVPAIRVGLPWVHFFGLEYLIVLCNVLLSLFGSFVTRVCFLAVLWGGLGVSFLLPRHTEQAIWQRLNPVVIQGNLSIEAERLWFSVADKVAYYQQAIHRLNQQAKPPHLVVLPEGVVTLSLHEKTNPFDLKRGQWLITGGILTAPSGTYNGAFFMQSGSSPQFVGKRYLVPFGEVNPVLPEGVYRWFSRQFSLPYSPSFLPGKLGQASFEVGDVKIGPLVCFEAFYPNLVWRYQAQNTDLLVTVSNLGWYHGHPWLEKQFIAVNQMRAAEARLPLILATNTGVSAFIDGDGAILSQTHSGRAEILTREGPTLHRPGDVK